MLLWIPPVHSSGGAPGSEGRGHPGAPRGAISWRPLPEVLYVLFFVWLICSGPGTFSVDHWLASKVLVAAGT